MSYVSSFPRFYIEYQNDFMIFIIDLWVQCNGCKHIPIITSMLGDNGYMFASVALYPQVDDENHEVILIFDVKPGKRAYIRHVTFSDNTRTNDVVLRREIEQMEAAPASTTKLDNSKH